MKMYSFGVTGNKNQKELYLEKNDNQIRQIPYTVSTRNR